MKAKALLTVGLTLFVAASVVAIVINDTKQAPAKPETETANPCTTCTAPTCDKDCPNKNAQPTSCPGESNCEAHKTETSPASGAPENVEANKTETAPESAVPTENRQYVVYYFFTNYRCVTCKKLEAYSKEAIETAFANEIDDGTIKWQALNIEQPANKHFIDDFQLNNKSVVVAEMVDGKCIRWTNLDKIWEKVRNKNDFETYVQAETQLFMDESE